jgi:ubiquinone/menaquinone biosynthesis C-methylase UbiE
MLPRIDLDQLLLKGRLTAGTAMSRSSVQVIARRPLMGLTCVNAPTRRAGCNACNYDAGAPMKTFDSAALALPAPGAGLRAEPGLPDYLVRHYSWAYLWPAAVWFFDHQPIINAILFGNYRRIMDATLRLMDPEHAGRTLQIAAVYGELTPSLARRIDDLHVIDVAPVQLEVAQRKLTAIGRSAELARMDAEALHYPDASFDTALMFLLLHELPAAARRRAVIEAVRVLKPGGHLVIAEYGEKRRHFFHRFAPMHRLLEWAEPFLGGFWNEDLVAVLQQSALAAGRDVVREVQVDIFGGFYRVARFRVT